MHVCTHILVEDIDDGLVVGLLAGVHERGAALRRRPRARAAPRAAFHLLALDLSALVEQVALAPAARLLEDARYRLSAAAGRALVHNRAC